VATTPAAGGNWKEFDWSALVSKPNVKTALMHEKNAIAGRICLQKEGCKGYGSYAGQLIEALERWQKRWTTLRFSFSEWALWSRGACMKPSKSSAEEVMV